MSKLVAYFSASGKTAEKARELAAVTGRHGWEKILDAVNSAYRLAGQNVNYRMVTVNLAAAIIEAVRN